MVGKKVGLIEMIIYCVSVYILIFFLKSGLKYDGDIINFMPYENNPVYKGIVRGVSKKFNDPYLVDFESLGIRDELRKNLKDILQVDEPNEGKNFIFQ